MAFAIALLAATPSAGQETEIQVGEVEPLDLTKLDPSIDWSVLNTDIIPPLDRQGQSITIMPAAREAAPKWSRTDKGDGSAAVTVNRALPTVWDTKVGVDFGLPAASSPLTTPERLPAGAAAEQGSGVAWANTTAPALQLPLGWDKASLDARFDPLQEQSKLGSRFSRSLPIGEDLSLTMESGFAITHLRDQPLPEDLSGSQTVNIFDTDRLAKINFLATGTSFGASSRKSSVDDQWLNSVSAEQKLFGGISVTGVVSETPEGDTSKSLTAGFRRKW